MSNFPKILYHKSLSPDGLVVKSEEQFKSLGSGWVDSPGLFDKVVEEPLVNFGPVDVPDDAPEVFEVVAEVSAQVVEPVVEKKRKRKGK